MIGYLELSARPLQPLHFELTLSILNPGSDPLTAVWNVELPLGIREPNGRRAFSGRTVVPPHRKLEGNHWLIAVDSEHAYIHEQIIASAELSVPERHFSDEFRASIIQIRVE
ncbi:MAG: hypothetical protein WBG54_01680 [Acidobacteriaceae bacterium]